ncbi:MAG TPA: hypothetical protein VK427_05330, partial [Kofleriaceae bacterium]|nr:hypothetical protein [Kofleriaceae bacterium]
GDVPSAAAVLLGLAVLVHELPREDGARWRVVLAAPAFAFAFYVRYGSVPVIALALGLAPIVWWRAVVARPWRVLAMYAMFAAFLVPHAMHAVARTGNILGVLRDAAGVPHRAHIGEGLVTYLTSNPFTYYGVVLAPCMLVGLLGVIRAPRRPTVFLAIVGVGQLVAIGLTSHGQPRYVFVAVCVLSILGVGALHPDMRPRTALAICAIAWVVALVWNVRAHTVSVRTRASIVVAARAIEHDRQRPCTVIASSLYQVLWYTRCAGYDHVALTPRAFRADHTRYLVHTAVGPIELAAFVDDHRVRVARELATDDPRTRVWVIRGPAD